MYWLRTLIHKGGIVSKSKKTLLAKPLARKTKASAEGRDFATSSPPARHDASDNIVVDRRTSGDRRKTEDRRKNDEPVATERRQLTRRQKVSRRRQIDPTTCERNYSAEEIEFMTALEGYKRSSGRMFPTCSEVLEVLRTLGYEKRPIVEPAAPCPPVENFAPATAIPVPVMAPLI